MGNYFTTKQLRAFRIPVSHEDGIKLALHQGDQELVESEHVDVKDISLTGLGFSTNKEFQIGQRIELKLEFADYLNLIDGIVVRCQEVEGQFIIGVVFNFEEGESFDTFFQKFIKRFSSKRMKSELFKLIKEQNFSTTHASELVVLNEIQSELTAYGNSPIYFDSLLVQIKEKIKVERLDVFVFNRENGKFQHLNQGLKFKESFDVQGSILERLLKEKITLNAHIISDALLTSDDFIHNYSDEFVICESITDAGGHLKGFVLASKPKQTGKYSQMDVSLMKLFSHEIGRFVSLFQNHMSLEPVKFLNPKKPREFAMIGGTDNVLGMRKFISQAKTDTDSVWLKGHPGVGRKLLAKIIHSEGKLGHMNFKEFNGEVETHLKTLEYISSSNRLPLNYKDVGTIYITNFEKMEESFQIKLLEFAKENEGIFRLIVCTLDDVCLSETVERFFKNNKIKVPTLNERKDDIPSLVNFLIKKECKKRGYLSKTISRNVLDKFKEHDWKGNVRELKNAVSRLVAWFSSNDYIDCLPPESYQLFESYNNSEVDTSLCLNTIKKYKDQFSDSEMLSLVKWGVIAEEMKKHDNNLKKTALALGKPHELVIELFETGESLLGRVKVEKAA